MTAEELLPLFREQFQEFSNKADVEVLKVLNTALAIHSICQLATVYLAAHICTIDADSGVGSTGGSVDAGGVREKASESAKSISASFVALATKDGDSFYTNTPYGRMYLTQRNSCTGRRFSVRVG